MRCAARGFLPLVLLGLILLVCWHFFRGIIGYLSGTATIEYTG